MKKQEFIDKLEGSGFPKSEYIILSGGSLLLRGLREETADFDLCASESLAKSLDLENCPRDDKGYYVPFEDVQMKTGMEGRAFDVIEGFQCETLESVLALKRRLMRPKDIRDIEVIEARIKRDEAVSGMELEIYIPQPEDGGFYIKMMSDPETMAYNAPWFPPDGCIPEPEEEWKNLCADWIGQEPERFYAYLRRKTDGAFVGDINFHRSSDGDWHDMGIVIYAPERGRGYGRQGLELLVYHAFYEAGISALHNDFETERDAAYSIHRAAGFREAGRNGGIIHLELTEEEYFARKE